MSSIPQERKCSRCEKTYPLTKEYFGINRQNRCGYNYYCRQCLREISKERRTKDPEKYRQQLRESYHRRIGNLPKREYQKPTERTCARCKQTKPLDKEHFGIVRRNKYGFGYYCCDCLREIARIEREEHPEKVCTRVKKWQQENPETLAESKRNWNEAHPEKVRQYWEDSIARHPERKRKQKAASQRRNRAAANERSRRYARRHPQLIRIKCLNRWAMFKEADGHFTQKDIECIYEEQHGRCAYCGITLYDDYEIDHIHPLTKGGSNWPDNLAVSCPSCNSSKNNHTIEEWQHRRGW